MDDVLSALWAACGGFLFLDQGLLCHLDPGRPKAFSPAPTLNGTC